MAGRKKASTPTTPTLKSAVISYILAQGEGDGAAENLPALRRFLKGQGIPVGSLEELQRRVEVERRRLDAVEAREEAMARLFRKEGVPKPPRQRRGSPFCPDCGIFKDHLKECPVCGKLEITI